METPPTYWWMGGLMDGLLSNHYNQINLDLIEIIELWTFWTFWKFYLNHLSPLWGYFSCHTCPLCHACPSFHACPLPCMFPCHACPPATPMDKILDTLVKIIITSMHSSRMCTTCRLAVSPSMHCTGGVSSQGVGWGFCSWGWCLLLGGLLSQHALRQTPPPLNRMTQV